MQVNYVLKDFSVSSPVTKIFSKVFKFFFLQTSAIFECVRQNEQNLILRRKLSALHDIKHIFACDFIFSKNKGKQDRDIGSCENLMSYDFQTDNFDIVSSKMYLKPVTLLIPLK